MRHEEVTVGALDLRHEADSIRSRIERGVRVAENGCWEWTESVKANGYGYLTLEQQTIYAHRLAYVAWKAPVPRGMNVCHRCDNRRCCNPDHLFLGTHKENMADAVAKGRLSSGERHAKIVTPVLRARSPLSWPDIHGIRAMAKAGATHRYIARRFKCTPDNISKIVNNKTWRFDDEP